MASRLAVIALVLVLAIVNWSIAQKENQLAHGKIVYLELAPVDPRSLMQGDYMALRFRLANEVYTALPKLDRARRWRHAIAADDGFVIVKLDKRDIGSFIGIYLGQALAADEMKLRYRIRDGAVKFATNAYFFQEGDAKYYQGARYGQFRVDANGELLLTAMYDKDLNKLQPPAGEPAVR
jgi:uncharacterized membrane-anchored protein